MRYPSRQVRRLNGLWGAFKFNYLVVFDDLFIVSRKRAREETSWERQKPEMGVFPDFPRVIIGQLGYLTKVVEMYRRKN